MSSRTNAGRAELMVVWLDTESSCAMSERLLLTMVGGEGGEQAGTKKFTHKGTTQTHTLTAPKVPVTRFRDGGTL